MHDRCALFGKLFMEFLLDYGYWGLFLGAFLAATILPMSSDIFLVGLLAAGADPFLAVMTATLGNWLGGMSSYLIGRAGKWSWIEKIFRVKPDTILKQSARITKYGSWLAFFTWLPFVGDVMAIALGFYRAKAMNVALFMLLGKGIRFVLWAVLFNLAAPIFS